MVSGYIMRSLLGQGKCGDFQQIFHPSELIAASTPLMELLPLLRDKPKLFVLESNRISGIVTCGDLQKAPVRMLYHSSKLLTICHCSLCEAIRLRFEIASLCSQ